MAGDTSTQTLIVAGLSLAMSALALGWQVVSHQLGGARVHCDISLVIHDDSEPIPSMIATVADRKKTAIHKLLQSAQADAYGQEAFRVVVRNRGRSPVSVDVPYLTVGRHYWGPAPERVRCLGFEMTAGTCRLEPGEAKTWLFPMWEFIDNIRAEHPGRPVTCRAAVLLGTGRWVKSKRANTWKAPAEMRRMRPDQSI